MYIYLVHTPDVYGDFFENTSQIVETSANHNLYQRTPTMVIVPKKPFQESISPKKFLILKERFGIEKLLVVDRVQGEKVSSVVQIIDHHNITGWNPLAGKTPLGELPRFPDMSEIYTCQTLKGIPSAVISTVGIERFVGSRGKAVSELVAPVALCASYVGIEVSAFGWNSEKDPQGKALRATINEILHN